MESGVTCKPLLNSYSLFLPRNAILALGGDDSALSSALLPKPVNLYEVAELGKDARFIGVTA